jgi:hypothetical protein
MLLGATAGFVGVAVASVFQCVAAVPTPFCNDCNGS